MITLDCRDGKHTACYTCGCKCHARIEHQVIIGALDD